MRHAAMRAAGSFLGGLQAHDRHRIPARLPPFPILQHTHTGTVLKNAGVRTANKLDYDRQNSDEHMIKTIVRYLRLSIEIAQHPLHREKPLRSVLTYYRWLASALLSPTRSIAIPYIENSVLQWTDASGSVLISARYGLGEMNDMAFCLHLLRPGDVFCDIGANAGTYTILATCGPRCRAVSIEPVPSTFNLLMQNVYANDVSHLVDARRIGIADMPGTLHFTSELKSYNHVTTESSASTIDVPVSTVDQEFAGSVPDLIKMDVEGFEASVLRGAKATLSNPKLLAVIIEIAEEHLSRYGSSTKDIHDELRAGGLEGPYWYDPYTRSLHAAGTPKERQFNQIFVRNMDLTGERLRTAAKYRIHGSSI